MRIKQNLRFTIISGILYARLIGLVFARLQARSRCPRRDRWARACVRAEAEDGWSDRDPVGPFPARRTKHVRFNNLTDPEPIPHETDYASVIESDVPIVVQRTRLDSRSPKMR